MAQALSRKVLKIYAAMGVLGLLTACATSQPSGVAGKQGAGQAPGGAHYKVGDPYQINGNWYYPKEDYSYDETGIASWYGDAFHDGTTANGEVFNKNELTAAHKTLPLPTLARVTNLDNGRSIVVRINDRGPFSGARIIDVSQRAAQLLGFEGQGTAKVRVQVLADESKAIADAMRHYGSAAPATLAEATQAPAPQSAALAAVETKTLEPVQTTPAVHQQLLATKPVATYVQLPVAAAGKIYVQAGAFTVLDNATKLQQQLAKLGPVSTSDIMINGTVFHRVRVGPVTSVDEADKLLSRIKRNGILNARTVVQ